MAHLCSRSLVLIVSCALLACDKVSPPKQATAAEPSLREPSKFDNLKDLVEGNSSDSANVSREELQRAIDEIEQQLAKEPRSPAWLALAAQAYANKAATYDLQSPEPQELRAREVALRRRLVQELPADLEALHALALAETSDEAREKVYRAILQSAPADYEAHSSLAFLLLASGRFAEAEAHIREGFRLAPRDRALRMRSFWNSDIEKRRAFGLKGGDLGLLPPDPGAP